MKKLLLILIIGTLFFSCKKERTFHITAKNAVTGEPYPGLSYNIERSWSGSFENKYKTVGSGVLDENGEVYFTKRLHKNSSYSISVAAPSNTCYMNSSDLHAGGEKNFKAEFEFAECAYLKLSIHNVNYINDNDYLKLYYLGRQVGGQGENIVGAVIREGGGNYSYVGNDFSSVPMGERYYKWEVTRNNVTNIYYDTIYLNPGEYKTYEINY